MKKIIISLSVITTLFFSSCMNIDVEPQNAVTFENYFKTEKDIQTFMNTIKFDYRYSIGQSVNFSTQTDKGFFADIVNDFIIYLARDLDPSLIHEPSYSSNSWSSFYTIITACNALLENIEKAELSQSVVDMYASQAYFYRAHTYFWLVMNWGEVPLALHSRKTEAKGKASVEEVLMQIISDTQKAIDNLPAFKDLKDESGNSSNRRDLVSKEAAYALLGYVYAWKASICNQPELYELAISSLSEVLKQEQYYYLAGDPEEVCTKVLEVGNHPESVFEVPMNWNDNPFENQLTPAYYVTQFPVNPTKKEGDIANAEVAVRNSTVDRMFPKGDLRREAYFYKTDDYRDEESLVFTRGLAYPYKFRFPLVENTGTGAGRMLALGNLRVMFRVADLLLLRAECYARENESGLAIADLNRVRSRSNAALYGVKEEPGDLRFTIFKEREKELLWENHRYFDAIRNGYYDQISRTYGELTPTDISNGAIYLPVESGAFSDNALMTQNKYWLSRY